MLPELLRLWWRRWGLTFMLLRAVDVADPALVEGRLFDRAEAMDTDDMDGDGDMARSLRLLLRRAARSTARSTSAGLPEKTTETRRALSSLL